MQDISAFEERLESIDPDDESELITAIRDRVRALSGRHLDIQERIENRDDRRRDLAERLQDAERQIIEQADATVEQDVTSIEDIESLPPDANPEFDADLLDEVATIREEARSNYQETAAEGEDLQTELDVNSEELALHREVLSELEDDEIDAAEARERLLAFATDAEN